MRLKVAVTRTKGKTILNRSCGEGRGKDVTTPPIQRISTHHPAHEEGVEDSEEAIDRLELEAGGPEVMKLQLRRQSREGEVRKGGAVGGWRCGTA